MEFKKKITRQFSHACIKKKRPTGQSASRFLAGFDYSPGSIAPIGHASAHVPQSMHTLGSIT